MGKKRKKKKDRKFAGLRIVDTRDFQNGVTSAARRITSAVDLGVARKGRSKKRNRRIDSAIGSALATWMLGPNMMSQKGMRMAGPSGVWSVFGALSPTRFFKGKMFRF